MTKKIRRRTYRQIRAATISGHQHSVYVVLLQEEARLERKVRQANPKARAEKPCVYVGMTGLAPKERFANHKNGIKSAAIVKRFGVRLMPEIYECFNPMPSAAAAAMERDLAEDLRLLGYTVAGGT